jgi:hypothetical protein
MLAIARSSQPFEPLTEDTRCCWQDDRLQDAMEELRGKFKAVAALLGLHDSYFPTDAALGMGF